MSNYYKQLPIMASKLHGPIPLQFALPFQVPHNPESIVDFLMKGPTKRLAYYMHCKVEMKV